MQLFTWDRSKRKKPCCTSRFEPSHHIPIYESSSGPSGPALETLLLLHITKIESLVHNQQHKHKSYRADILQRDAHRMTDDLHLSGPASGSCGSSPEWPGSPSRCRRPQISCRPQAPLLSFHSGPGPRCPVGTNLMFQKLNFPGKISNKLKRGQTGLGETFSPRVANTQKHSGPRHFSFPKTRMNNFFTINLKCILFSLHLQICSYMQQLMRIRSDLNLWQPSQNFFFF